ncbi:hypothetical protein [Streptomyces sp. NPDC002250]|uniref:hypothetical protein n=1 Tax=Streptomyces sp. NPDC002250 TaxID=3364641 RepID=UPI0036CF9DF0
MGRTSFAGDDLHRLAHVGNAPADRAEVLQHLAGLREEIAVAADRAAWRAGEAGRRAAAVYLHRPDAPR